MVLFMFKKVIALLFSPIAVPVDLLLLGVVLLLLTRRQKAGKALVSAGTLLLLLLSSKFFSGMLLGPLEYRYPPLLTVLEGDGQGKTRLIKYVVVLAGGVTSDPMLTPLSQLGADTMVRLAEGIRVYRELPGSRLIVSGTVPEASAMAKASEALGVNPQDVLLETESIDTESEARLVRPMVGAEPFILVTSASHMPRAMALFRKQGTSPIPDPTDYLVKGPDELHAADLCPSGDALNLAQRALYEYMGLTWERLWGHI